MEFSSETTPKMSPKSMQKSEIPALGQARGRAGPIETAFGEKFEDTDF